MKLQGYNDRVPLILVLLANELLRRGGLDTEGIFRVRMPRCALRAAAVVVVVD